MKVGDKIEFYCFSVLEKGTIVEMVIGISRDEMVRCKESRLPYIKNNYPLVFDKKFNRGDCMEWLKNHNHPLPKKSACTFCPYHSNEEWKEQPAQFSVKREALIEKVLELLKR